MMHEQRTGRSNWVLALALILGLGLGLSLTNWATAQGGTPNGVETPSGATITVDTKDDELADDGDCSLREALQAANTDLAVDACPAGDGWDTINVPAGTYILTKAGAGEDANATGDLDVLESVTILGAGASSTTLDGNADDRVFHVDPAGQGVVLDLRGVLVTNGASDAGGGLRAANGLTRIQDSVFRANVATASGGAIQADLGTLRVLTSTIENNDAGATGKGGGIYVDVVALTIQGSTIENNTAQEGGGLYNTYGSVTIRDTDVISNTAAGTDTYGGGIFSYAGNLIIEAKSEIGHNRALTSSDGGEGGGIWTDDETRLVIMDSWVHHNESDDAGAGTYAYGYGTYVRKSTIEHNTSGGEGGGFYVYGDLILVDSTVQYNHSADSANGGGGIFNYNEYAGLVISNTLIYSNTTDGYGGGVYVYQQGGVFVANSIFRQNRAADGGGGLYLYTYSSLVVEDSVFEDNVADNGGGIYADEHVGSVLERTTFSGNRAAVDGGALYFADYSPADIRNCTLSQNHADGMGGAITAWEPLGLESSTIVGNTAGTGAGALWVNEVAAQNSIIAGNNVGGNASAADADCDGGLFSGGNNLLGDGTGCQATRYDQKLAPGTIYAVVLSALADNGGPDLPDGSHPKTHALLSGSPAIDAGNDILCPDVDQRGAARPQGNACDVGATESGYSATVTAPTHHIITVTTANDVVGVDGECSLREAVTAAHTDKAANDCPAGDGWDTIVLASDTYTLTKTGASEDLNASGDLDIISDSVTISGTGAATTIIDGNNTDRVFDVREDATLYLRDVTVTNGNTTGLGSTRGGCIATRYGLLTLLDSVVSRCVSPGDGGGIRLFWGTARLLDTVVEDNRSGEDAGGLMSYGSILSIRDSTIIGNTAADLGGGVYAYSGATRISGSDVFSNTLTEAASDGGGLYLDYGALVVDEGSRVMHNRSPYEGGGIYVNYGGLLLDGSTISHNSGGADGGGVCFSDGGLWMRSGLVEHNKAGGDGGGIYYASGLIEDSTIRHNEAITNTGGGLLSWSLILNSTISGNKAAEGGGISVLGVGLYNSILKDNAALDGDGGGIYVQSSSEYGGAILVDSTLSGNTVDNGRSGAGVYADTMPVTARGSTFSGNSGADLGGGIYSHESVVDLLNSTVSGNSAVEGAGIHVFSGTMSLNYSTVANNTASSGGGGVYNAKTTVLENSIVAGNQANGSASNASADCKAAAPITFGGHGLFGDSTGCAAEGRSDQTVAPPTVFGTVLGPLANHGGPQAASNPPASPGESTWTHALLPGSPALDAGDGILCPADDQRDVVRPQGAACDVGAYEARNLTLAVTIAGGGDGTVDSEPAGIACAAGGGDCNEAYTEGLEVTLTPSAGPNSIFAGWSGACTHASGDCVVTMDAAKSVTATFDLSVFRVYLPAVAKQRP